MPGGGQGSTCPCKQTGHRTAKGPTRASAKLEPGQFRDRAEAAIWREPMAMERPMAELGQCRRSEMQGAGRSDSCPGSSGSGASLGEVEELLPPR